MSSKKVLICVRCWDKREWYPTKWFEVMEHKISSSEFLCEECVDELKQKAIKDYYECYFDAKRRFKEKMKVKGSGVES